MEQQDKYIRFDWAVKRLLRQKANFGVLEGFLTVLLGENVKIIEILESESNQQTIDDKFNRVDIKARNSKDEIIIVEIQNTRELYYLERILYGVAKAITEHISLGERYYAVKKIYSISILYFDIGKGKDYLYHGQNHFIGVHTGDRLEVTTKEKDAIVHKIPAEIFPEYFLIRVNEFDKVAVTPLEEWIEYLKTGCIRPDTKAPGLEEARRKLIYYNMSKEEQHAYDEHLSAIMISAPIVRSISITFSGVKICLLPSMCERNSAPSSRNLRIPDNENTWKPPLSVSIGRSKPLNLCSPPAFSITSSPGRR